MKSKLRINLLIYTLVSSLIIFSMPLSNVNAEKIQEDVHTEIIEVDGEKIEYKTIEKGHIFILRTTSDQGFIEVTRNGDKIVNIESDILSNSEIEKMMHQSNDMILSLKEDKELAFDTALVEQQDNANLTTISPMAQTGPWSYGKWRNYTVTSSGKVTAQIIVTTVGGVLGGKIGAVAGGIAAIFIEHNIKTGYLKIRSEYRNDTSVGYYWERQRIHVYKDSARTRLLGTRSTQPKKYPPPT